MLNVPWLLMTERVLLTLWVGSIWAIGYVAAPILFAVLETPEQAGTVAGEMFTATAWLGLVCGTLLVVIQLLRERGAVIRAWRFLVLLAMLALTVTGEFVVRSWMEAARGTESFGPLHGLAQGVALLVALLGLVLVAAGPMSASGQWGFSSPRAARYGASSRSGSGER